MVTARVLVVGFMVGLFAGLLLIGYRAAHSPEADCLHSGGVPIVVEGHHKCIGRTVP